MLYIYRIQKVRSGLSLAQSGSIHADDMEDAHHKALVRSNVKTVRLKHDPTRKRYEMDGEHVLVLMSHVV